MAITCKCLGMLTGGKWDRMKESNRRVYDPDFISPTITTCGGGNQEVKIIDPQGRKGKLCKPSEHCPTIWAEMHGNPPEVLEPVCIRQVGRDPENPTARKVGAPTQQMIELYQEDGCTGSLTTVQKDNMVMEPSIRIRKLVPIEVWRLMGFSDEDFGNAEKVNSNSQLYKQAGNSIVVNVLMEIFKQMLPEEE